MRNPGQVMAMLSLAIGALLTRLPKTRLGRGKLMEDAFNRRYRWSEGFKGFSADFTFTREGKTVKGSLKADVTKPHGGVEVDLRRRGGQEAGPGHGRQHRHPHPGRQLRQGLRLCSLAIAGDGAHGGTKIAVSGHGFFKDFTVKDGQIIENHGGHGAMSSEVKVRQVVWMADSGKTLPREYAFTIKTGDHEQSGKTTETWREIDGVWLPTWYRMTRTEGIERRSRARSVGEHQGGAGDALKPSVFQARSKGLPRQAGMASETDRPLAESGTSFSWARRQGSRCAAPTFRNPGASNRAGQPDAETRHAGPLAG